MTDGFSVKSQETQRVLKRRNQAEVLSDEASELFIQNEAIWMVILSLAPALIGFLIMLIAWIALH